LLVPRRRIGTKVETPRWMSQCGQAEWEFRRASFVEEWLNSVLARIRDGTLLPEPYYVRLDCDAALKARDDHEFDAEWVRHLDEIDRLWASAAVTAEARALAEDIRRESFLAVSSASQQHEIASYVSDDFDLIVRSRLVGARARFLDQLWDVYDRGEFPRPLI
jgi:hypothetical protein